MEDRREHVAEGQESGSILMGLVSHPRVREPGMLGTPRNSSPVPLMYKEGLRGPEKRNDYYITAETPPLPSL